MNLDDMNTPGMVTHELEALLNEAFLEWDRLRKESPYPHSDTYGLLLMLMKAVLDGPDPGHLERAERYLRLLKSEDQVEKRNSLRLVT